MSKDPVSRRALFAMAGAAAALPLVPEAIASASQPTAEPNRASLPIEWQLIAPLGSGSKLGSWTIDRALPLAGGAVSIVLTDLDGATFQLDVCARDRSDLALRGPATTERFEIFLANGGDGDRATHEDHGLAAMALADVVRSNEARISLDGFATLAERIGGDRARVHLP